MTSEKTPPPQPMTDDTIPTTITKWVPFHTERVMGWLRPLIKGYFRSDVRGLESFPPGGVLVVANHSGGMIPVDVPVFATGSYEQFGYERPDTAVRHPGR